MQIIDITPEHYDRVFELNERFVHFLSPLARDELAAFVDLADYAKIAKVDGVVAGFLIGFACGASYGGENFRFFSTAFESFLYIDRIVVDDSLSTRGIGQELYRDFEREAALSSCRFLTCEVDIDPPNARSLKFHEAFGFVQMNTRTFERHGKRKTVSMMFKHLNSAT